MHHQEKPLKLQVKGFLLKNPLLNRFSPFPSSHFTKLTRPGNRKGTSNDLRLEAILFCKREKVFSSEFWFHFFVYLEKSLRLQKNASWQRSHERTLQLGMMVCRGDRYHLKPKCEAGTRSPGHAVFSDHTWKLQNVQHFSSWQKMVFHVTWRLSVFHRNSIQVFREQSGVSAMFERPPPRFIYGGLLDEPTKRSGVWDPLPRSCVFCLELWWDSSWSRC